MAGDRPLSGEYVSAVDAALWIGQSGKVSIHCWHKSGKFRAKFHDPGITGFWMDRLTCLRVWYTRYVYCHYAVPVRWWPWQWWSVGWRSPGWWEGPVTAPEAEAGMTGAGLWLVQPKPRDPEFHLCITTACGWEMSADMRIVSYIFHTEIGQYPQLEKKVENIYTGLTILKTIYHGRNLYIF